MVGRSDMSLRVPLSNRTSRLFPVLVSDLVFFRRFRRVPSCPESLLFPAQDSERSLRPDLRTSRDERIDESQWCYIGTVKRRIGNRRNPKGITEAGNRTLLAVGDSERRHTVLMRDEHRLYSVLQAPAKAYGEELVLWSE